MVIKSRRMRLAGNVAHMGEIRNAYKILVGFYKRRVIPLLLDRLASQEGLCYMD
jgi:hypothetical protein